MNWIKQHPVKLFLIIMVVLNLILISIVFTKIFQKNAKTASIKISVVPTSSRVIINGQEYENGDYDIAPGDYQAIISKDGFHTKEINFHIDDGQIYQLQNFLLSDDNFQYYISNGGDRELLRKYINESQEIQKFFERYDQIVSINNILPMYSTKYAGMELIEDIKITQDPVTDCPTYVCLLVTSTFRVSQDRINEIIKDRGFNPENYQFNYKIYTKG